MISKKGANETIMQYKYDVLTLNPKTDAVEFQTWSGIFETITAMREWYETYGSVHESIGHEIFLLSKRIRGEWKMYKDKITSTQFLKAIALGESQ